MDGHGVGRVRGGGEARAEAKAEDLSVSGATRADREKLLAGLRDAPARERRWAAAREKEKGNELFKAREYRSAIEAYDVSIALDAAKRAVREPRLAYMKLRRWSDAARDCDAALALDPEHFKALLRRGACALEATAGRRVCGAAGLRAVRSDRGEETHEGGRAERRELARSPLAKKTLNETGKPRARRYDAPPSKKMTGFFFSSSSSSSSEPSKKAPPSSPSRVGADGDRGDRRGPSRRAQDGRSKSRRSDSDDDDDDASIPIDHEGSSTISPLASPRSRRRATSDSRVARTKTRSFRTTRRFARSREVRRTKAEPGPPVDGARAVLYANRAASLEAERFAVAERDANDATCDPTYVKGFHRRAAARAGLNAFEGALEDYEVVRAAPESEALRREVNACMEKAAGDARRSERRARGRAAALQRREGGDHRARQRRRQRRRRRRRRRRAGDEGGRDRDESAGRLRRYRLGPLRRDG